MEKISAAKQAFRKAVAQEIADISTRKHVRKDFSHISPIHVSMLGYHPFLSKDKQVSIDAAWETYKNHEEYRSWAKPNEDPALPEPESWAKAEAIKHLKALLAFSD